LTLNDQFGYVKIAIGSEFFKRSAAYVTLFKSHLNSVRDGGIIQFNIGLVEYLHENMDLLPDHNPHIWHKNNETASLEDKLSAFRNKIADLVPLIRGPLDQRCHVSFELPMDKFVFDSTMEASNDQDFVDRFV
jgi:hypothetical protein